MDAHTDKLIVNGPAKLRGRVRISPAKNAYLPIIAGALLSSSRVVLKNVPDLSDIHTMLIILETLGVKLASQNGTQNLVLEVSALNSYEVSIDSVTTSIRALILLLGPLLGRFGRAKLPLPGGCKIGQRPIDIHVSGLHKLGARIDIAGGYIHAETQKLCGATLKLRYPSVGATENIMMAAVLAEGKTVIENAATEPEIGDLADFLNGMGASISGVGTKVLTIHGVTRLTAAQHEAVSDRIEAATYMMAALATKSEIEVVNVNSKQLECVIKILENMGAKLNFTNNSVVVKPSELLPCQVETAPYPGFPTDLQAPLMALLTQVKGISIVREEMFENRFLHVTELKRLGARIALQDRSTAIVEGGTKLVGSSVHCTDLRAGAALMIAALAAEGTTEICCPHHLDRGYETLEQKLRSLGADVQRITGDISRTT